MFDYDADRLRRLISELTRKHLSTEAWAWLSERLGDTNARTLNSTFALISRKTGKQPLDLSDPLAKEVKDVIPGLSMEGWTSDRLARICLLVHLDPADKEHYFKIIEDLFRAAEVTELEALYTALPFLAYPADWTLRCAEGIRSNIGTVLEAVMYGNPYPATYLSESAWNQLVMKAFFTDKDIARIYGLRERANEDLSQILSDYAHERWAAGRQVNPQLWRVAGFCPTGSIISDLEKVMETGPDEEKEVVREVLREIEN